MMSEHSGRAELKIAGANRPWPAPAVGHALPSTSMACICPSSTTRVNTETRSMGRSCQNREVNCFDAIWVCMGGHSKALGHLQTWTTPGHGKHKVKVKVCNLY